MLTEQFIAKIAGFRDLPDNWNSYGAAKPNEVAIVNAMSVAEEANRVGLDFENVVASSQDCIDFYVYQGDRYASIECYNDGWILASIRRGEDNHDMRFMDLFSDSLSEPLMRIKRFLETDSL